MTDVTIELDDIAELNTPVGLHGATTQMSDPIFGIIVGVVVGG